MFGDMSAARLLSAASRSPRDGMADQIVTDPHSDPYSELDPATERTLVVGIQTGDSAAFLRLVTIFSNRLMRFAFHIVGSRDAAEDVVQQVFVQLWERHEAFNPYRVKPYLFGAVRNRALKERRTESVRQRHRTAVQDEGASGMPFGSMPSPENRILTSAMIQTAIAKLPERRRLVVRLRLEEEMTNAEIAEVLGLSVVAAKRLVARAIVELRNALSEQA